MLVLFCSMFMVFSIVGMALAEQVDINLSWPVDKETFPDGIIFDFSSRSHVWRFVLADWHPEYAGWVLERMLHGLCQNNRWLSNKDGAL